MIIKGRIGQRDAVLSDRLRAGADAVATLPITATPHVPRGAVPTSGVSHAAFPRLAQALGAVNHDRNHNEGYATAQPHRPPFMPHKQGWCATDTGPTSRDLSARHSAAALQNEPFLEKDLSEGKLEEAVVGLHRAKRVLLVGSLGSSGLVDLMGHQRHWFKSVWSVAGRSYAAALSRLTRKDTVSVLCQTPRERGATWVPTAAKDARIPTMLATGCTRSPAPQMATHAVVVPTERPPFLSSYAATVVLLETLVRMLLARAADGAEARIQAAKDQLHTLGEPQGS